MEMKMKEIFFFISFFEKYEYSKYTTILSDYSIDVSLRNYKGNGKTTNNKNNNNNVIK